jgi:hypothetical protein
MNLRLAEGATGVPISANPSPLTPEERDNLLAPIALYPDALLMQVLAASVNSQEVLDGGNWLLQNNTLKGDQLDDASKNAGFGPAMSALMHFPQVVDMMCSEIDWTRQLGDAFTENQTAVLDAVQKLRLQAQTIGNLKTTPQQTVVTEQVNGQQVIVIQPANPQVIYVPQYNPVVVYSTPPPVAAPFIAFGVGMAVGLLFRGNNYYYPRWGPGGGIYYRGNVWVSRNYIYRPVYRGNYRVATAYRRPANYPYAYNRPYPGNTRYNPSNYYNNYRGNQNRSNNSVNRNVSGNNVTINTGNQINRSGNTTTKSGSTQTNQGWKGQSTYNGGNKSIGNLSGSASTNPSTKGSGTPARSNSMLPAQSGTTGANGSNTSSNRNRTGQSRSSASNTSNGNSSGNSARNFSGTNPGSNDSNKSTTQAVKPDRATSSGSTAPRRSRTSGGTGATGRSKKPAVQRGPASTQANAGR